MHKLLCRIFLATASQKLIFNFFMEKFILWRSLWRSLFYISFLFSYQCLWRNLFKKTLTHFSFLLLSSSITACWEVYPNQVLLLWNFVKFVVLKLKWKFIASWIYFLRVHQQNLLVPDIKHVYICLRKWYWSSC